MSQNEKVSALLAQDNWTAERKALRAHLLDAGLEEAVKWGKLAYTHDGANVAIIYGMKAYCAIGFFKGALLDDPDGALVAPGKHSQAMRQLRFESVAEINARAAQITAMIATAIEVEKQGLEIAFEAKDTLTYPDALQAVLDEDPDYAAAFERLTPGRQRGWVLHISDAKKPETRRARAEKAREKVMNGKGVNER
ncbi:YdeI/OmpD-associated family protein [Paracoccaceae bacterium GXU_MW_L88]